MNRLLILSLISLLAFACRKDSDETCSDGIQNQNETAVDCGGVCNACPSCFDGMQNQDETDVDCGGVCDPCPTCFDGIQNQNEVYVDCGGVCGNCPSNIYPFQGQSGQENILHSSYTGYVSGPHDEFKVICTTGAPLSVKWITNGGGTGPAMGLKYGWVQVDPNYEPYTWFVCETDSCDCEFFLPPPGSSTIYVYEDGADTTGIANWSKTITH